jgi:hypothetical protein
MRVERRPRSSLKRKESYAATPRWLSIRKIFEIQNLLGLDIPSNTDPIIRERGRNFDCTMMNMQDVLRMPLVSDHNGV